MTGRARAWKCRQCTRLTVRMENEKPPQHCDHCTGDVTPFPLRPARPYLNPWERP